MFDPEGHCVITVSNSGAGRLFSLAECTADTEAFLKLARDRSTRGLTPRERQDFRRR